jgi:hypothetical protein
LAPNQPARATGQAMRAPRALVAYTGNMMEPLSSLWTLKRAMHALGSSTHLEKVVISMWDALQPCAKGRLSSVAHIFKSENTQSSALAPLLVSALSLSAEPLRCSRAAAKHCIAMLRLPPLFLTTGETVLWAMQPRQPSIALHTGPAQVHFDVSDDAQRLLKGQATLKLVCPRYGACWEPGRSPATGCSSKASHHVQQ